MAVIPVTDERDGSHKTWTRFPAEHLFNAELVRVITGTNCPVQQVSRNWHAGTSQKPDLNEAVRVAEAAREVNGAVVACWLR